jgi:Flp pilus assembly protein TadD
MGGLAQFLVGHVLSDRYRLDSVLGQGGFGVVFRAADLQRGREVAVKVLDPPRGMGDVQVERLRQRFGREAEMAACLPLHPNLVRVLDFGSTERLDYLVMELLRGESLRERMARPEPVPLRSALHVLRDAARGVAVGHENGLVHRDLKPANLFLEESGSAEPMVRVLDFGIAKVLDEADDEETRTHLTLPGEWFGSEFYSPPEHLRRERVTRASDVYSLGVVAFELLTRSRLFTADDQVRRRQGLPVPIPSMAARNPAVPREVEVVVRRALAESPADRWEDAGEMATELHRALGRLRRAADLPSPVPAAAPADATAVQVDGDATVLAAAPAAAAGLFGLRRRTRDVDPTGLEDELERLRIRTLRTRAVKLVAGLLLGTLGVAGGYGIAAMRAAGEPAPAAVQPRATTAAEENEAGLARFRRGDYAGAAEAFAKAVQRAPGQAEYANNHAYALLRAGQTQAAVQELLDVVAQHPEREIAYSNLAEGQLALGDTASAIASLQALLALDPAPVRRREAEIFLDRLGAHETDLAEWEDSQAAPVEEADSDDEQAPWEGLNPGFEAATDTVSEDGGVTVTERYGAGGAGVIRRRRRDGPERWADTVLLHVNPRDTLRFAMPRVRRP